MIDPARIERLQELFEAALELPPAERSGFVAELDEADRELAAELEALLRADADPSGVLDQELDELVDLVSAPIEDQVGPYRIGSTIGRGGMGVVYEAVDTRLGRTVALKFLPKHLTLDPQAKSRFIQEARAASALDHPHICTIFDIGDAEDGRAFIAMARYEGQSLADRLDKGPLTLDEGIELGEQVASALAAAHAQGIVHRDVKPGNIFLTADRGVRLLDFGVAKVADGVETRTGGVLGTARYASPEQLDGRPVDTRTDQWSLAVVLREAVSGKHPFQAERTEGTVHQILTQEPRNLGALEDHSLGRATRRALAKDPESRFATVEAFGRAISPHTADPSVKAPASTAVAPWWRWWGAAAALIGAVAFGLWGLQRESPANNAAGLESLAVLPLANFTGDPGQEYLADGLTDAIIADLSQIESLAVISRTSVMRFKGSDLSSAELARELGVEALVEGSVVRDGDRVGVTLQLVDGRTERPVWSTRFDQEIANIVTLQNDIARAIASEIQAQLSPRVSERLARTPRRQPAAVDAYVEGRALWNRREGPTMEAALERFLAATESDPDYAEAWAALGETYMLLPQYSALVPSREANQLAEGAIDRALDIDPDLGQAHAARATLANIRGDFDTADQSFARALELTPGYASLYQWYGIHLLAQNRVPAADSAFARARTLDPFSPVIAMASSFAPYQAFRFNEALGHVNAALGLDPEFLVAYRYKARNLIELERFDEAEEALRAGRVPEPHRLWTYLRATRDGAVPASSIDEVRSSSGVQWTAAVFAAIDQPDSAFVLLSEAVLSDPTLSRSLVRDPKLIPLHADARWSDLVGGGPPSGTSR